MGDDDFTVAIIGLGLIGGSLARDLAATGVRVLGYDRDAVALREALAWGVLSEALNDDFAGVEHADVVVIAVPVSEAASVLAELAPKLSRSELITDVGSTKRAVCEAAAALGLGARFVGGHPLAGGHESGWASSRRELFRDARVFLCPLENTEPAAIAAADALWRNVGARPERIAVHVHDRRLAWTSHLPQLASSALALALAERNFDRTELGPGGRDVTRLAGSDPKIWTGIATENRVHLAEALLALELQLRSLRGALVAGHPERVRESLLHAAEWHRGNPVLAVSRMV